MDRSRDAPGRSGHVFYVLIAAAWFAVIALSVRSVARRESAPRLVRGAEPSSSRLTAHRRGPGQLRRGERSRSVGARTHAACRRRRARQGPPPPAEISDERDIVKRAWTAARWARRPPTAEVLLLFPPSRSHRCGGTSPRCPRTTPPRSRRLPGAGGRPRECRDEQL